MSNLQLNNINKIYPNKVQAVFDFNLNIKDKEFIVFVGPSGCGKSTTLRMVAGLEEISAGELYIDGDLMNNIDPKDRNISMVFQNYALYPHMTVYGNMKFALKLRKVLKPVYVEKDANEQLLEERDNIIKQIKALDKKFKKDQNGYEKFMQPRAELYRSLYAAQEKIEASMTQAKGIDEYSISIYEKQIKKFNKEIQYNKKVFELCSPDNPDEVELSKRLEEIIAKREKQIVEIQEKIEHLKVTEVPLFKPRNLTKIEIDIEINKVSEKIDLIRYLYRKPGALSGGQRQRVALGRAIVRRPKVFLMDEPLSNLDAKLRVQTRSEITKIHKGVGATTIYVTHDQTEAMTMADRIVVMKDGYIQQIGTPEEVYDTPTNKFVAGFIGSPAMNFIDGVFKKDKFIASVAPKTEGMNYTLGLPEFEIVLNKHYISLLKDYDGKKVTLGIRPEFTYLKGDVNNTTPSKPISCKCDFVELLGFEYIIYAFICGQRIIAKTKKSETINDGDDLEICFDMSKLAFFDEKGNRITLPKKEKK